MQVLIEESTIMPDYTMKNLYNQGLYEDAIAFASEPDIRDGFTDWDYLVLIFRWVLWVFLDKLVSQRSK